jgi:hypothetical protein
MGDANKQVVQRFYEELWNRETWTRLTSWLPRITSVMT